MDWTFLHIDRVDDLYTVRIDGEPAPVVFAGRAEALSAALDIARAKWSFAGQPSVVSYPLDSDGTDVLYVGGAGDEDAGG